MHGASARAVDMKIEKQSERSDGKRQKTKCWGGCDAFLRGRNLEYWRWSEGLLVKLCGNCFIFLFLFHIHFRLTSTTCSICFSTIMYIALIELQISLCFCFCLQRRNILVFIIKQHHKIGRSVEHLFK